jgi:hypothetical protein
MSMRYTFALVCALLVALTANAQSASDLDCDGCVSSRDIADHSVQNSDIAWKTIGTKKLRDGAVTMEKLSPDIQSLLSKGSSTSGKYVFVGFSADTRQGDAGYAGMAAACAQSFGPLARLATTSEIFEAPFVTDEGNGTAWVQDDVIHQVSENDCYNWSQSANTGPVVNMTTLSFLEGGCINYRRVACSAPTD